MKFVVVTQFDSYIVEADDIDDAIEKMYNSHCGFSHIESVTHIPDYEDRDVIK